MKLHVLVLMIAGGSCSMNAMFKTAAVKKVMATVATVGSAAAVPKIKGKVEQWQLRQQLKQEIKKQNEPMHSER